MMMMDGGDDNDEAVGGGDGGDLMRNLCVFASDKAGMESVDRQEVNRVIYESSKGSAYFQNQKRRDDVLAERIQRLKDDVYRRYNAWDHNRTLAVSQQVHRILGQVELDRVLTHTWIHVDMDMFFAAVEIRDHPHLRDKPVAVGSGRMIATSNYVARRYGVRAAMPGFIGRQLCPDLVFVQSNRQKYVEAAEQTRRIFQDRL